MNIYNTSYYFEVVGEVDINTHRFIVYLTINLNYKSMLIPYGFIL